MRDIPIGDVIREMHGRIPPRRAAELTPRPNAMAARGARSPRWLSWTGLVYYGETVGFVVAWIAGLTAIVYSSGVETPNQPPLEQVAVAESLPAER